MATAKPHNTLDLRYHSDQVGLRGKEIKKRRQEFVALGFSTNFVTTFEKRSPTLAHAVHAREKIAGLVGHGFSDPVRLVEKNPVILSLGLENIAEKLRGLKERGFAKPARMVEKNPSILNYGFDNIDGKLSGLKARGFEKPERLVEKFSAIFAYGFDNIDGKLSGLKARGFTKPTKIVERSPSILAYSFENIDEKLKRLREMGFAEPVRLVEKFPGILSLSLDNINDKLKGLKTRGFDKPVKLVERKPVIVGLNFKNIDWKMKMLSRLISLYNLPFTVTGMMERHTAFFGIKNDKLRILTRIAKEASHRLEEVDNGLIKQLLFANLEDEIIASRQKPGMNPKELLFAIGTVKKRQLSREEKREIIETLPKEDKVKRRYFRGYPK